MFQPTGEPGARVTRPARGRPAGRGALDDWVALTGTPGAGKSAVARELARHHTVLEVAALAPRRPPSRRRVRAPRRSPVIVDLGRAARALAARRPADRPGVVVGHLAHLLPLRDAVVLRCDPLELDRRLLRRGDPAGSRQANVVAEATDLVLVEALELGRRVWEVDTTRRTPAAIARSVERLLARRPPSRAGRFRWLERPGVAARLLRREP